MSKNISTILAVLEGGSWEGGRGGGNGSKAKSPVHFPKLAQLTHLAGQPTSVLLARKSFPRKYVISFHSFS